MKIISKRGRKPQPPKSEEIEVTYGHFGIIIIDGGVMTPEEIRQAEDAMKELRRQLDDLQNILDRGWYNLRKHQA